MIDIPKCSKFNCKLKTKCWRYLAPPNKYWQSYLKPTIINNKCLDFWDINPQKSREPTNIKRKQCF